MNIIIQNKSSIQRTITYKKEYILKINESKKLNLEPNIDLIDNESYILIDNEKIDHELIRNVIKKDNEIYANTYSNNISRWIFKNRKY